MSGPSNLLIAALLLTAVCHSQEAPALHFKADHRRIDSIMKFQPTIPELPVPELTVEEFGIPDLIGGVVSRLMEENTLRMLYEFDRYDLRRLQFCI